MGGTESKQSGASAAPGPRLTNPYAALMASISSHASVDGGGPGRRYGGGLYSGGVSQSDEEVLREATQYERTLADEAKQKYIRALAVALKKANLNVDPDDTIDNIVAALKTKLPSAGNKFIVTQDSRKLCLDLAKGLNDAFTPGATDPTEQLINMRQTDEQICKQVVEWVHSFTQGVNTEFIRVHAAAQNLRRNLEVLDDIMTRLYDELTRRMQDKPSEDNQSAIRILDNAIRLARQERQRQMVMLDNMLRIDLAPAYATLQLALKTEKDDLNALLSRIDLNPRSGQLADALTKALSGLTTTAVAAHEVGKALKRVGLRLTEYTAASSIKELDDALDQLRVKLPKDSESAVKFVEAAQILRRHFGERKAVAAEIQSTGGAPPAVALDEFTIEGGAGAAKPLTMDERIEKRRAEREVLVKEFKRKLDTHVIAFCGAIGDIAAQIGDNVPIGDKTDMLRDALQRFKSEIGSKLDYVAPLIGVVTESSAREQRDSFITAIRTVRRILGDLLDTEAYSKARAQLQEADSALEGLLKDIEFFYNVIQTRFGGAGAGEDMGDAEVVTGAGARDYGDPVGMLNEAIGMFVYRNYTAQVRKNLAITAKDIGESTEKYPAILGDAVAARLLTVKAAYEAAKQKLTAAAPGGWGLAAPQADITEKTLTEIHGATVGLYKALQAIDLYLREFSLSLGKDPEALADIVAELSNVAVIAKWFTLESGDDMAKAFDNGRGMNAAFAAPAGPVGPAQQLTTFNGSYLSAVANRLNANTAPIDAVGVPQVSFPDGEAANVKNAKDMIAAAFGHQQALKNLINVFMRIGDKFSDGSIRERVFMTPTQIFKALQEFMIKSSLCVVPADRATPSTGAPDVQVAGHIAFSSAIDAVTNEYAVETFYLALALRAMVGKVLTAVGTFRLLERRTPLMQLTPLRITIGGGSDDAKVIAAAAPLYFRLPRLVELYAKLFGWQADVVAARRVITMIPDLVGVFSELIRIVFLSSGTGEYTSSEVADLVRAINAIYEHYASRATEDLVHVVVLDLIKEVNRRYGIIKREDLDKYRTMIDDRGSRDVVLDSNDYNLLPGEEDAEGDVSRAAPSDIYREGVAGPAAAIAQRDADAPKLAEAATEMQDTIPPAGAAGTQWPSDYQLVYDLRKKLTAYFKSFEGSSARDFADVSFRPVIEQAQRDIDSAATEADKFMVATRLIRTGGGTGQNRVRSMMVHEMIVSTLTMLTAVQQTLAGFVQATRANLAGQLITDLRRIAAARIAGGNAVVGGNRADVTAALRGNGEAPVYAQLLRPDNVAYGRSTSAPSATAGRIYALFQAASNVGNAAQGANQETIRAHARAVCDAAAVLLVDYDTGILRHLESLAAIRGLGQGLVDVKFTQSSDALIFVDFTPLRTACEDLLNGVRKLLDIFRLELGQKTIQMLEGTVASDARGTVYWLEHELFDLLLRPRETAERKKALDACVTALNADIALLLAPHPSLQGAAIPADAAAAAAVDAAALAALAGSIASATAPQQTKLNLRSAFMELVYYSGVDAGTVTGHHAFTDGVAVAGARNRTQVGGTELEYALLAPADNGSFAGTQVGVFDFVTTSPTGFVTPATRGSLMFLVNALIARLLVIGTDPSAGFRIYRPLVSAVADGPAATAVGGALTGGAWNDLFAYPAANAPPQVAEFRGDPEPSGLVVQSIAIMMQRLTRDLTRGDNAVSRYLIAAMADVPTYKKEALRCNLPLLKEYAQLVLAKISLVREALELLHPNVARLAGVQNNVAVGDLAQGANGPATMGLPVSVKSAQPAMTIEEGTTFMQSLLVQLNNLAQTVAATADQVLRELNDAPVHFGIQLDAIQQYQASNGGALPVMPLSLGTTLLRNNVALPTPTQRLGTAEYSVAYGLRYLLLDEQPSVKGAPAVAKLLETYNATSKASQRIDQGLYDQMVAKFARLLQFVVLTRSSARYLSLTDALQNATTNLRLGEIKIRPEFVNTTTSDSDIVLIVTARDRDRVIDRITAGVTAAPMAQTGTREEQQYKNIIDLNVIPLNVQALQRRVPLFNIMNYSYALEAYLRTLLMLPEGTTIPPGVPDSTKKEFLRLIMQPYRHYTEDEYGLDVARSAPNGAPLQRVLRGVDGLGLGRPRFISDALPGVLFQSAYTGDQFDESGPAAGFVGATALQEFIALRNQIEAAVKAVRAWPAEINRLLRPAVNQAGASGMLGRVTAALTVLSMESIQRLTDLATATSVALANWAGRAPLVAIAVRAEQWAAVIRAIAAGAAVGADPLFAADAVRNGVTVGPYAAGAPVPPDVNQAPAGVVGAPGNEVRFGRNAEVPSTNNNPLTPAYWQQGIRATIAIFQPMFDAVLSNIGALVPPGRRADMQSPATSSHTFIVLTKGVPERVVLPDNLARQLQRRGYCRFNTLFVRYMINTVELQRVLRMALRHLLVNSSEPITAARNLVDPNTTEYGVYPHNPNEGVGDRVYDDDEGAF